MRNKLSKNQAQYFIEETPTKVIVHEYKRIQPVFSIRLSSTWWMLGLVIIGCIGFLLFRNGIIIDEQDEYSYIETISTNTNSEISSGWMESGFMFVDSDSKLITENDIIALAELYGLNEVEVIQYAINEMYARNHYYFSKVEWFSFYSQFDWYTGSLDLEEARSGFNSIEMENLSILTKLRKSYK